jgi:hypothetical protein
MRFRLVAGHQRGILPNPKELSAVLRYGRERDPCREVLKVANKSIENPNVPIVPDGDDGNTERFRLAVNLLRIFEVGLVDDRI